MAIAPLSAAPSSTQAAPDPRLVRAAHEFEAQMMKELLQPLNSNDPLFSEDEDSGSSGALGEFASEALARALSDHGGLGIANRIVAKLSATGHSRAPSPVTAPRTSIP